MVLDKTLESPLDCKEIQPVRPKGHQSWVFVGRTDAEAETPVLWPPHVKSWLIGKDPDAGRDWGKEEKGMTEDEMDGWHHQLDGHEFEWTPGVGDGQGGLACCNSWGLKELDMTERVNWTELNRIPINFPNRMFGGIIFSVSASKGQGVWLWGKIPSHLKLEFWIWGNPSWLWGHHIWGKVQGAPMPLSLLPSSMALLCGGGGAAAYVALTSFSEEKLFYK